MLDSSANTFGVEVRPRGVVPGTLRGWSVVAVEALDQRAWGEDREVAGRQVEKVAIAAAECVDVVLRASASR